MPIPLLLAGCGYVGEPLPPSLNIPERIADLSATERGDKIVLTFTISALTTDGAALTRLGAIELEAGETPVPVAATRPGPVRLEVPARDWTGKEVVFRVRVAGRKGRFSNWSNAVALAVVPPLEKPPAPRAEATAQGVRLQWSGPPEAKFRVYRLAEKQKEPELLGEAAKADFLDAGAEYGQTYHYSVQAVLKAGRADAESDVSAPVEITPQDRFPPSVPSGIAALAGIQTIELAWERNTEADLRGYRVYRAAGDGPFARLAELVETPSYSDRKIESGLRYRYTVTAVDINGNESEQSGPAEITAP
ncbi:MAG: hypothetical protein AAB225_02190 [Acidobacteriota bacterium]